MWLIVCLVAIHTSLLKHTRLPRRPAIPYLVQGLLMNETTMGVLCAKIASPTAVVLLVWSATRKFAFAIVFPEQLDQRALSVAKFSGLLLNGPLLMDSWKLNYDHVTLRSLRYKAIKLTVSEAF